MVVRVVKMPIFQDDLDRGRSTPLSKPQFGLRSPPGEDNLRREDSEESIRTELCDGPLLALSNDDSTIDVQTEETLAMNETVQGISDRGKFIESPKVMIIKRMSRRSFPSHMLCQRSFHVFMHRIASGCDR